MSSSSETIWLIEAREPPISGVPTDNDAVPSSDKANETDDLQMIAAITQLDFQLK